METSDERRPLLSLPNDEAAEDGRAKCAPARQIYAFVLLVFIIITFELAGSFSGMALMQVQEGIICRQYHPDVTQSSQDARCKDKDVQGELSYIQGWEASFLLIPGFLTSIPYGIAADKYSRKAILALSVTGMTFMLVADIIICMYPDHFPIRLLWAAALISFIGGGPFVFSALVFAIANDISTEAQRSTAFFYLGATAIGGALIASPLTYFAMERGIWFSVFLGLVTYCLCTFLTIISPRTRDSIVVADSSHAERDQAQEQRSNDTIIHRLRSRLSSSLSEISKTSNLLFSQDKRLGALLISVLFTTLGKYATSIILQYARNRFGWTWAEVNLLLSVRAVASLALTIVLLPGIAQFLLKKLKYTPLTKDLILARGSILLLVVGSLGLALSITPAAFIANLLVFSLGAGLPYTTRSLIALLAQEEHIGLLYATMGLLESAGSLVAGPLLAASFKLGLQWGGAWLGFPFIAAAALFSISGVIVMMIDPKNSSNTDQQIRTHEE